MNDKMLIISLKSKKIKTLLSGLILIVAILTLVWFIRQTIFAPKITSVSVVNLADQSASLLFWSDRPARYTVKVTSGEGPVKAVTQGSDRRVHEVDFAGLEPNKNYTFEIDGTSGQKSASGKFTTPSILRKISVPKTVYGTVVDHTNKPVSSAVVTLRRVFLKTAPQIQSEMLVVVTNDTGNFVFDLNNASVENVPQGAQERLEVKIWTQDGKTKENLFVTGQVQPLPTIALD